MTRPHIIFLDIDGVLVIPRCYPPSGLHAKADPECVAALNAITDATDAAIVISSVWRYEGLMFMREWATANGITGKVMDVTYDLRSTHGRGYVSIPRHLEIEAWLDDYLERRESKRMVILDDGEINGPLCDALVRTQYSQGLTAADARRAIAKLEGRCG